MTINAASNNPRIEYTVGEGATQTIFTIPFEFFEDPEVKLYVDGALKTQGSGDGNYTVTGGEGSTGTATFNTVSSGPQPVIGVGSDGSTVIIVRDIPIERVTDFSAGADINRAALNTQLDTLTALVSDADTNILRTLTAPVTDANIDMSLPDKATRLGKALGFNSSTGNPEAVSFYDSAADVRAAVEAASDSNVFTDADHNKLNAVEDNATADQTKADIDALNINADLLDGQHGSYYTGYADTAVSNLVDSAPSTLDTLNELAAALGDDANFSTTVTNSIATKMPLAGGTFTGDVTFDGTSYNVIWDESANALRADANAEFWLGSGGNTKLYHNGSNSYIDNYTGHVFITNYSDNKDILIKTDNGDGGSTNYFLAKGQSGEALLYHYGSEKLSTKSTGIDITGNIVVSGTVDGRDVATDGTKLDGVEASATADQTASEILTAVKTVDGASSGLDADLLDGQEGSYYTNAANLTGTLPAIDGSNLTNVEASKVYINEVSDSLNNTDLNVLFSDTSGSGNVQMQPQQDDGGLTFNPDQNILKVINFQVDDVSAKSSNSHLYLRNLHDNFGVIIQADNGSGGATNYFKADGSTGEAVLYHYGNSKLKTKTGGVDITGDITVSGDINLSGAITEDVYVVTLGSGTHPIEPSDDGGIFYMTVSANCSLGVSNLANGQSQVLMIDDGNGYTITWPTMTWINNGGSAPTLSTTARTTVVVWKANNVVYGALVGDGT